MRVIESQRERMGWASEELKALGHLVEEIISRNPFASGEEYAGDKQAGPIGAGDIPATEGIPARE